MIKADMSAVGDLFEVPVRFTIPTYQRPYVWDREDQWEPLWRDVRELADELLEKGVARPHFMGAVVIDNDPQPVDRGVKLYTVVDGQQRLTTIQVLLEALADNLARVRDEGCEVAHDYHDRARGITRNRRYGKAEEGDEFKVWPMNLDQRAFRAVMEAGSPQELRTSFADIPDVSSSLIARAYVFFYENISNWLREKEELGTAVEVLYAVLHRHVELAIIDLRSSVDPQLIFETLNARNTPLSPADLIKNHLFRQATISGIDGPALFARYWQPFEDERSYWTTKVGKGAHRTERISTFVHQYLTLQLRGDVQTDERRLYKEYKRFADATALSPLEQLGEIRRYGDVFRGLDALPERSREAAFISRLRAMEITTVMPFVLALMGDASVARSDRVKIMEYLESYLVRRMVCGFTGKAYNRVFVDLLAATDESGITPDAVRRFMLAWTEDTNVWPDDRMFHAAWMTRPAYRQLVLARLRMILLAVEPHVRSDRAEDISYVESALTVEHLLPQTWQSHYPLPDDGSVDEAQREILLHTLGNLALLTSKLNSSVSNGRWSTAEDISEDRGKRAAILKHSGLAVSRMVVDYRVWDDAAIKKRGEALFKAALKVWPKPEA